MKRMLFFLLPIFIISCNNSPSENEKDSLPENEKILLELKIHIHNEQVYENFRLDSFDNDLRIKKELIYKKLPKNLETRYFDNNTENFKSGWNKPYNIKKDMLLTLPKYLEYCKAYNYDSKTYIDFIDK